MTQSISPTRLAELVAKMKETKVKETDRKESVSHLHQPPITSPHVTATGAIIEHPPKQISEIDRRNAALAASKVDKIPPIQASITPAGLSRLDQLKHKLAHSKDVQAGIDSIAQPLKTDFKIQGTETGRFRTNSSILEEIERRQGGSHVDKDGRLITYNTLQNSFVSLAETGESCVLIGAAGTGKTTCMQGALSALEQTGKIPLLQADGHKHLIDGTPGCVIIAYTRRATNNIRRVLPDNLKNNAITAHKLLEYAPEFFEVMDEEGNLKKTMRFVAGRNQEKPLPSSIHTIVVEESSMLSVEMYNEINLALIHKVQWIFLGDINQLPPVFGSAVLGFRLLDLPTVELTEVYRQALESPIIRLAHRILSGKIIPLTEYDEWFYKNQLKIHSWKKKISADDSLRTLAEFFKVAYDNEIYNVEEDIILIPYNKSCGTIELNKHIANHIARKHKRTTHEVIAGFNKFYFSVGDRILYDKEDAEIIEIKENISYTGARFQAASKNLDYWGHNCKAMEEYQNGMNVSQEDSEADIDFLLDAVAAVSSDEDRVRKASHNITVRLTDTGTTLTLDTAAAVNNILHAYALTVHKAQGSEWRKVYLCLHQSHATMLQRELLYTAVTRAKQELYVICEPDSFTKGIERQRIKGDTLKEKAEFFKGKLIDVQS